MRFFTYILLGIIHEGASGPNEEFKNFLTLAMQNFPGWIRSSGLDPFPSAGHELAIDLNFTTRRMEIFGSIQSQVLYNYSDSFLSSNASFADWSERAFYMDLLSVPFGRVDADYFLQGHVAGYPVRGNDTCSFDVEYGMPGMTFMVRNFGITSDGFIDLSVADYVSLSGRASSYMLGFNGLETPTQAIYIELHDALKDTVNLRLSGWMKPLLNETIVKYFSHVFSSTPVSDIISVLRL